MRANRGCRIGRKGRLAFRSCGGRREPHRQPVDVETGPARPRFRSIPGRVPPWFSQRCHLLDQQE
jgi:hypothetical protein